MSHRDPEKDHFFDMAVLRPGDRVLLSTPDQVQPQELRRMNEILSRAFPGVKFLVANGINAMIQKAEDT